MKNFWLILAILTQTTSLSPGQRARLYIWSVGQGQWLTWVSDSSCLHFDMGGEQAPLKKIKFLCASKRNILYLSHADNDHIQFINWGFRNLTALCLQAHPRESLKRQKRWLLNTPLCRTHLPKNVIEITYDITQFNKPNDLSRVYLLNSKEKAFLIPGDSTVESEKAWVDNIDAGIKNKIRGLILGHHGSKTSTHLKTLNKLKNLKMSFCSARKKRYGHPHPTVTERLHQKKIPLASTEAWGNLIYEM